MTLMLQEAKPEVQGVNVRCGTRGDQEGRFVVRFIFGGMGEGWLWGFWSHTCEVSSSCGGHFNALRFHACISLGGGASGGRWLGRRQSQNQREGPHTPTLILTLSALEGSDGVGAWALLQGALRWSPAGSSRRVIQPLLLSQEGVFKAIPAIAD